MNTTPLRETPDQASGLVTRRPAVTLGNIALDFDTYDLRIGGRQVYLSRQEFDLLVLLLRERDRVLPREVISESLWPHAGDEDFRRLNTAVHRLRVKLSGSRPYGIRMVRRRGYGLCRDVPTSGVEDLP